MKGAQGRASHSSDKHSPLYCDKITSSNPVVREFSSGLMMSHSQWEKTQQHEEEEERQTKFEKHMRGKRQKAWAEL